MVPKPGWWSANINTDKLEPCPNPAACSYPNRRSNILDLRKEKQLKELSQFGKEQPPDSDEGSAENDVVAPAMESEELHERSLL